MESKNDSIQLITPRLNNIVKIVRENCDHEVNISIPKDGYGACKADGCNCNGYKPNDPKNDYCRVCGHHWTRHW